MYSYSLENVRSDLDVARTEKKNDLSKTVALNKGSTEYNISDGLYSLSHSNLVTL